MRREEGSVYRNRRQHNPVPGHLPYYALLSDQRLYIKVLVEVISEPGLPLWLSVSQKTAWFVLSLWVVS